MCRCPAGNERSFACIPNSVSGAGSYLPSQCVRPSLCCSDCSQSLLSPVARKQSCNSGYKGAECVQQIQMLAPTSSHADPDYTTSVPIIFTLGYNYPMQSTPTAASFSTVSGCSVQTVTAASTTVTFRSPRAPWL